MKKTAVFMLLVVSSLFMVTPAFAGDYGQYGGAPPSQKIAIEKTVFRPSPDLGSGVNCSNSSYGYTSNYIQSDTTNRLYNGQYVCFRLRVTNTGNVTLFGAQARDYVPSYLNPVAGPGSFDSNNRIITIGAGDFAAGEQKDYYLLMQVANSNMPAGTQCVTNKADVVVSGIADDASSSQICLDQTTGVSKGGLAPTSSVSVPYTPKIPQTGPEMGLLLMAGEGSILGLGLLLKKRSGK